MKICVGTVTYRGCHPSYATSMVKLTSNLEFTYLHRRGDWLLERARSILATHFLTETSADVLLWIDADMVFEPDDVREICEQAVDYSVIGGLYMMRHNENASPAARVEEPMSLEGRPRPVRAAWVGTGFLATHRRVFEALAARSDMLPCQSATEGPFWPFYYPMLPEWHGSTYWLGEDVAFCERAREEGFEVYVSPGIQLGHMGGREFRVADMVPPRTVATPRRVVPRVRADGQTVFHLEVRPIGVTPVVDGSNPNMLDLPSPVGAGGGK